MLPIPPPLARLLLLALGGIAVAIGPGCRRDLPEIAAVAETDPVASGTDAADDIAIWVNPQDPQASLIVAVDKVAGILLYDLQGQQLQFRPDGNLNNVDLRTDVPWGDERITLVAASERRADTITCYRLDSDSRRLQPLGAIPAGVDVYGFCLYAEPDLPDSPDDGRLFAFVTTSKQGLMQYELTRDPLTGLAQGQRVRHVPFASKLEGCVADDVTGIVWIGEESRGVWKLDARPPIDALLDEAPVFVIAEGRPGPLREDVEGLTLYAADATTGWLIVSSQGDSTFAVFDREVPHAYAGSFRISAGSVDAVSGTDGIDVTSIPLGPSFPDGLFIVQDDKNDTGNQNYKLISWADVADALDLDTPSKPRPPHAPIRLRASTDSPPGS